MHIDLRNYITIDNKPMEMEIKQGSFVKEIGKGRTTDSDLPIKKINFDYNNFLLSVQRNYPSCKIIKEFTEPEQSNPYINKESFRVLPDDLLDILNTKYLPAYISSKNNGHRNNTIIPDTFGFLIKRNMPRSQMEVVLNWINSIAEIKKLEYQIIEIIILIIFPMFSLGLEFY